MFLSRSNSSPEKKLLLKSAFPDNDFVCEKDAVSSVASGSSTYQVLRVNSTNGTLSSVASGSTGGSNPNTIAITGYNN